VDEWVVLRAVEELEGGCAVLVAVEPLVNYAGPPSGSTYIQRLRGIVIGVAIADGLVFSRICRKQQCCPLVEAFHFYGGLPKIPRQKVRDLGEHFLENGRHF
jgi:hypothetical protein